MTALGLSAEDFADIHVAVGDAMGYVAVPVTFFVVAPASDAMDPMYGEVAAAQANWRIYGGAPVYASVKIMPTDEELTRYGLLTGASLLGFIPQQRILDWQAASGLIWTPQPAMEVAYMGVRYNVTKLRTDWLPVGDGTTFDTIGPVFCATTKPSKLPA